MIRRAAFLALAFMLAPMPAAAQDGLTSETAKVEDLRSVRESGWTGIDPAASSRFGPSSEMIAEFGPDAPLRGETFAPYPRIAPIGFHFDNPVSGRVPEARLTWSDGHRD